MRNKPKAALQHIACCPSKGQRVAEMLDSGDRQELLRSGFGYHGCWANDVRVGVVRQPTTLTRPQEDAMIVGHGGLFIDGHRYLAPGPSRHRRPYRELQGTIATSRCQERTFAGKISEPRCFQTVGNRP